MKGSRLTALPYVLWSIAFVVIPLDRKSVV